MDTNIIQIILTMIAVGVIGGMKYYERQYGDNPEAWDIQKFGFLIVVAFVIMVVEYTYGNAIAFPAEDIIVPAMALFGSAYTMITAGKLVKKAVVPVVASAAGVPVPITKWDAGFTCTPTESKGISPFTQKFHMTSGSPAADHPGTVQIEIDWADSTPKQLVNVVNNFAEADHTFSYKQAGSQYTGHQFYPVFTTISSDGTRQEFNVDGKAVAVEVQSA